MMVAATRARRAFDPVGNFNFTVELDGLTVGRFSSVEGLAMQTEMIEYRTSDQPLVPRYRPGIARFGTVTLKRGLTDSPELMDWMAEVQAGIYRRRNLTVTVLDNAGEAVASWNLYRCLPSKWQLGTLDGMGGEALHETIELKVEEAEVVGRRKRYAARPPRRSAPRDPWRSASADGWFEHRRPRMQPLEQHPSVEQSLPETGSDFEGQTAHQWLPDTHANVGGRSADAPEIVRRDNAADKDWAEREKSGWVGGRQMLMGIANLLASDGHIFNEEAHAASIAAGMAESIDDRVESDSQDQSEDAQGDGAHDE